MNSIETKKTSNALSIPTSKVIGFIGMLGVVFGAVFRSPILMSLGALLVGAYLAPIMPIWANNTEMEERSKQTSMRYYFWLAPASVVFMIALYSAGSIFNF